MAVRYQNFDFQYTKDSRPYFAPSELGRRIGNDIKAQVEAKYSFDAFVYHLGHGGHVAALHSHREHAFFARVDIRRFFYSIARTRVQRALSGIGVLRSRHYAKWSTVRNPYGEPRYVLPYGFIQSPILATLVLLESALGSFLRRCSAVDGLRVSIYMDDIAISSNNQAQLTAAYQELLQRVAEANFTLSEEKMRSPASEIDLFNCDLSHGLTQVRPDRIAAFNAKERSEASRNGFERYVDSVIKGNVSS